MIDNIYNVLLFTRYINDIKNVKPNAHQQLVDQDVSKWLLFYDCEMRYETMTTSASKCFNRVLKCARELPINALIIVIYYNLVMLFLKRAEAVIQLEKSNVSSFSKKIQSINYRELMVFNSTC